MRPKRISRMKEGLMRTARIAGDVHPILKLSVSLVRYKFATQRTLRNIAAPTVHPNQMILCPPGQLEFCVLFGAMCVKITIWQHHERIKLQLSNE